MNMLRLGINTVSTNSIHLSPSRIPLLLKRTSLPVQELPYPQPNSNIPNPPKIETPKNAIVLAHGLMGFDELRLAGKLLPGIKYWRGIADALAANGIEVITTSVSAVGSIEQRAEMLSRAIERRAGGKRVNIVAHSMVSFSVFLLLFLFLLFFGFAGRGWRGGLLFRMCLGCVLLIVWVGGIVVGRSGLEVYDQSDTSCKRKGCFPDDHRDTASWIFVCGLCLRKAGSGPDTTAIPSDG